MAVGSGKNLTKKQLEGLVGELQREVEALTNARSEAETNLETAHETIRGQIEALNTARAEVAAAEEAANAARAQAAAAEDARAALQAQVNAATGGGDQVAGNPAVVMPLIERPTGSGWSIREAMQVDHVDYAEIQRTIRSLVICSQLDWTDDFRRQDADKLATMFRAARKAHPVLHRYINNWATAAIARQYMQNKRKHAYKQGYIKKRPNAMDGNNKRQHDDDDAMGGAGAGGTGA
ncbi:hypothetical protein BD413DRAFT_668409 [Trametes elegans]|nr:hypothetical protein BD413DRAFT_668409 [Trametes elegans]